MAKKPTAGNAGKKIEWHDLNTPTAGNAGKKIEWHDLNTPARDNVTAALMTSAAPVANPVTIDTNALTDKIGEMIDLARQEFATQDEAAHIVKDFAMAGAGMPNGNIALFADPVAVSKWSANWDVSQNAHLDTINDKDSRDRLGASLRQHKKRIIGYCIEWCVSTGVDLTALDAAPKSKRVTPVKRAAEKAREKANGGAGGASERTRTNDELIVEAAQTLAKRLIRDFGGIMGEGIKAYPAIAKRFKDRPSPAEMFEAAFGVLEPALELLGVDWKKIEG